MNIIGSHQYDAVHFFGDEQIHVGGSGLMGIAGAAENAVVAVFTELLLQIIDGLGKIQIRAIRTHDSDGLHGVEPQASGKGVWGVFVFMYDIQHPLFCFFADVAAPVQNPGDGGDGNPCFF